MVITKYESVLSECLVPASVVLRPADMSVFFLRQESCNGGMKRTEAACRSAAALDCNGRTRICVQGVMIMTTVVVIAV